MARQKLFRKRRFRFSPDSSWLLVFGFAALIVFGAVMLSLPCASKDGVATDFLTCLFTSASATCVTGLVVVDTFTHWTVFGQAVILVLIQIGGLGFMTFATLISLVFRRGFSVRERLDVAQSLNLFDWENIRRTVAGIVIGTFSVEAVGAVILSAVFSRQYGAAGIWKGIFTAVSAFCNAGFDLMGQTAPFSSLTGYAGNVVVNVTVMALVLIGGLGFLVWSDLFTERRFSRFSVFSKTVLVTSGLLVVGGAVCLFIAEYNNPATMAEMPLYEKILASLFQSVAPRTAGFNTVDLGAMTEPSRVLMMILMFIGASSGSTGGGLKVSTFAVLFASARCTIRGRKDVVMFGRRIPSDTVMRAVTLFLISVGTVLVSATALSVAEPVTFQAALYECISAFATVGSSVGITSSLGTFSRIWLILLMYLGRVGVLTVTYAMFLKQQNYESKIEYPEGRILIG